MMGKIASVVFAMIVMAASAERLYVNDLKVPDSQEDLLAIEHAVHSHLERTRQATVCLKVGEGSGTGVIISKDGLVLTAAHVSAGVNQPLTVVMEDGREFSAVSLGLNSENDAAMVQIQSEEEFPFVEIEAERAEYASSVRVGDWVYALGHSGGFDKERGSVVRLGRVLQVGEDTLQTDCSLIGGDSGGPLFDMEGVLVGIHSRVGVRISQNMHVPISVFHRHWKGLKGAEFIGEGAFATRPKLGSGIIGVALKEAEGGLQVTELDAELPAAAAGMQVGDVLVECNTVTVKSRKALRSLLDQMRAGEQVELSFLREGERKQVRFPLAQR